MTATQSALNSWRIFTLTPIACLVALATVSGCGSAYRSLPPEDAMPELAALKRAACPSKTSSVVVREAAGRQSRLALHVTESPGAKRMILFIHGVGSNAETWRFVRASLRDSKADLVAVDLLGCGQSDTPAPDPSQPEMYSPRQLSHDVLIAIRARLAERPEVAKITLVGHSLGGMMILRMLGDPEFRTEFPDLLSRIDGAVMFAPLDVAVEKQHPAFREIAEISGLEVGLGDALGIIQQRCALAIHDSVADAGFGTREEADRVLAIFRDGPHRVAMQAMLMQAIPFTMGRPDWLKIEPIAASYAQIKCPCLIVWGARDEVLPTSMGYKLAAQIPGAELHVIPAAMHCLSTECPSVCGELIQSFINDSGNGAGQKTPAVKDAQSNAYRLLPSEDAAPELAALKRAALPSKTSSVVVREIAGRPARLALHSTESSGAERMIIFIHGVGSNAETWRFVRASLHDSKADLVAVDLLGCGQSDTPAPDSSHPDMYSPRQLSHDVLVAIRARLAQRPGIAKVTVVGHSLGGMMILRMLGDPELRAEFPELISRIDGAVMFAPLDVAVEKQHPAFREIAETSGMEVGLGDLLGIIKQRCAIAIRDSVVDSAFGTREEADRVLAIFRDRPRRLAMQAMLTQAIPFKDRRPDWLKIEPIAASYAQIKCPCLIVWGARDEVLPTSMGYKLAMQIPRARLHVIPTAMHCLSTECPRACGELIQSFVDQQEHARD